MNPEPIKIFTNHYYTVARWIPSEASPRRWLWHSQDTDLWFAHYESAADEMNLRNQGPHDDWFVAEVAYTEVITPAIKAS